MCTRTLTARWAPCATSSRASSPTHPARQSLCSRQLRRLCRPLLPARQSLLRPPPRLVRLQVASFVISHGSMCPHGYRQVCFSKARAWVLTASAEGVLCATRRRSPEQPVCEPLSADAEGHVAEARRQAAAPSHEATPAGHQAPAPCAEGTAWRCSRRCVHRLQSTAAAAGPAWRGNPHLVNTVVHTCLGSWELNLDMPQQYNSSSSPELHYGARYRARRRVDGEQRARMTQPGPVRPLLQHCHHRQ